MGSRISKKPDQSGSSGGGGGSNSDPNPNPGLSSYESACRDDPDLRRFDSTLQLRTTRAINSIALNCDTRALSLDSLREVTESLLETNHEVVQIILQNKRDIWKNPELSDLVDDYFENSLATLDFCTSLETCLKRAGLNESIINVALKKFEEEHNNYNDLPSAKNYPETLQELKNFKSVGDPFTPEFFNAFNSVHSKQIALFEKLQAKKRKLDKKLKKVKAWRKVSNVIFVVSFASVLICSVVAAAIAAPPVLTALAAAAVVPLLPVGKWLNKFWNERERDLMGQIELINSMQVGSYIVIKDLDAIKVLVERFREKIEALVANVDFAERGEEAVVVAVAVAEIRKKVDEFITTIHDLIEHSNKCKEETRMARTLILRKIINYPGGTNQDIGMFS